MIYTTIILVLIMCQHFLMAQTGEIPHKKITVECTICHSSENWQSVIYDHSQTHFKLTARHEKIKCRECHKIADFSDINENCKSCHSDIHQGRLGNWCEQCHTPVGWTILRFDKVHANTVFPIIGAHALLDCNACHYSDIAGEFSPIQSDCFSCHDSNYRAVTSPNHVSTGFSKKCDECHSLFSWQPAEFKEHDRVFPIFSGTHAGEWNSCKSCHYNPGNYSEFSCLNCHEHNRGEMDSEHDDVPGYTYNSHACYSCHPTGTEGRNDD